MIVALAALIGLAAAPASHAQAPAPPILEAPAVLGLPEASHASVRRFLNLNTPRALAFGPNGAFGWQAGGGDAAFVEQTALTNCEKRAGPGACSVALRDLAIVKPGQEWAPNPPPGDVAITSPHHATLPDDRFIWWGPQEAQGVLVFGHGKQGLQDLRGRQPQSWTRHFNKAGPGISIMRVSIFGALTANRMPMARAAPRIGCAMIWRNCAGVGIGRWLWRGNPVAVGMR